MNLITESFLKNIKKKKYCVVVAHPDDEILWASSLLENAEIIIICFSGIPGNKELTIAREKVKENYTLPNTIFLDLYQASPSLIPTDWKTGERSKYGMKFGRSMVDYKENYFQLIKKLDKFLSKIEIVYTHSPWGEYGHPEHVQVNHSIIELSKKYEFETWVFGYTSKKTLEMMEQNAYLLNQNPKMLRSNLAIYDQLKKLYITYGCWTYFDNYKPPNFDIFYKLETKNLTTNLHKNPLMINYIENQENNYKKMLLLKIFYKLIFFIRISQNLIKFIFKLLVKK